VAEEVGVGDELWIHLPGDGVRGLGLLARAGLGGEDAASRLAQEGFAVDDAAVSDVGANLVPVGYRGRFTLQATGAQVLCRVHAYAGARYVRGCQGLTLPSDGRIRASVGEAGFRVGVR